VIENTSFQVFISNLIEEELQQDIFAKTKTILANIVRIFGAPSLDTIFIYFLPKTPDGYEIYTKNWSNNISLTMSPPTNSRWKRFTSLLLDVYLLHKPTRTTIYKEEDYWLIDGLKYYYGDRSLEWIKRTSFEEIISTYKRRLSRNQNEIILSRLFADRLKYLSELENYKMKSTYVLDRIDHMIRQATQSELNIDTFLPYYFKRNKRNNLANLLSEYLGSQTYLKKVLGYVNDKIFRPEISSETDNTTQSNLRIAVSSRLVQNSSFDKTLKLLHMARHHNYLENCGCKTNQNGGIARLATIIKQKRNSYPDLILLNLGDNIPIEKHEMELTDFTRQEVALGFRILNQLRFDALNISFTETLYSLDYLMGLLDKYPLPYINSNIRINLRPTFPSYKILFSQSLKIGILGVSHDQYHGRKFRIFEDNNYYSEYMDPITTIMSVVDFLRNEENVDLIILMCNLDTERIEQIAKADAVDLILTSFVEREPGWQSLGKTYFLYNTLIVHSDIESYGLMETNVYLKEDEIVSATTEVIELSDTIQDDPSIRLMLNQFYLSVVEQVENLRKIHLWEDHVENAEFVGTAKCRNCHTKQYVQWKSTAHATAFTTLTNRHRNYFPNCVQCHVTAFQFAPGFSMNKINDNTFQNVQCEMCHGPGSEHIEDPVKNSLLKVPSYGLCVQCHDEEHSNLTKGNFLEYYEKVVH